MDSVFFSQRGDRPTRQRQRTRPSDVTPFDVPYLSVSHRDPEPLHSLRRKPKFSSFFKREDDASPRYRRNSDVTPIGSPSSGSKRSFDSDTGPSTESDATVTPLRSPYTPLRSPYTPLRSPYSAASHTAAPPLRPLRRKTKASNLRLRVSSPPPPPPPPPPTNPSARADKPRGARTLPSPRVRDIPSRAEGRVVVDIPAPDLVDEDGRLKSPVIFVGIKPDLEAEVHLDARVRGLIQIGLY